MKKRFSTLIILVFISLNTFSGDFDDIVSHINAADIFKTIDTLSSEKYEGRLTGTKGFEEACKFAANTFKQWGLVTEGDNFLQPWPVEITKVYDASLTITTKNKNEEPETLNGEYFTHFYPMGFSGCGSVEGEVVFAGYGITAPEYHYDDFKNLDVTGKIVMIFKGVPGKTTYDWSTYDSHRYRTKNVRDHGGAGLLYITQPVSNPNGIHLDKFPILQITEDTADILFKSKGTNAKSFKSVLDLGNNSSFYTEAHAEIRVESEKFSSTGYNVVGMIPGENKTLSHECVIISAHLDHTGRWPLLCPGAEDNGSGSAVVIALAKAFTSADIKPERPILFILFGGEEMGLLGSEYFVSHLPQGIDTVKFAINMDMVGAGPGMFILGLKKEKWFEDMVTSVHNTLNLKPAIKGNARISSGGSDHGPFIGKGFSAVSVFSSGGDHHGYHTPEDTIYWITPKILEDVAKLVGCTALEIANMKVTK